MAKKSISKAEALLLIREQEVSALESTLKQANDTIDLQTQKLQAVHEDYQFKIKKLEEEKLKLNNKLIMVTNLVTVAIDISKM